MSDDENEIIKYLNDLINIRKPPSWFNFYNNKIPPPPLIDIRLFNIIDKQRKTMFGTESLENLNADQLEQLKDHFTNNQLNISNSYRFYDLSLIKELKKDLDIINGTITDNINNPKFNRTQAREEKKEIENKLYEAEKGFIKGGKRKSKRRNSKKTTSKKGKKNRKSNRRSNKKISKK
jgi:hypothetical protein